MQKTIDFIKSKTDISPEIGLILGSGLGDIAEEIEGIKIPYNEIPNFAGSHIEGHKGNFVIGELCGKKVVAMQGRYHFYEGHSLEKITFPVKIMKKLGVKKLILTNAAGGVNKAFKAGDLMLITDHINFFGTNPLIGLNDNTLGERFPDCSEIYKKDLIKLAENVAKEMNLEVKKGVYLGSTGPSYETPAEINAYRLLGADAVGMSTVPEAIVANWAGMDILGISCITNMASGVLESKLSHEEVIETANNVKSSFVTLLKNILTIT